jgi:hypothetical protein
MSSDTFVASGTSPTEGPASDFLVENHGSIFFLRPVTPSASDWISENIPTDALFLGDALAVEHRYMPTSSRGSSATDWPFADGTRKCRISADSSDAQDESRASVSHRGRRGLVFLPGRTSEFAVLNGRTVGLCRRLRRDAKGAPSRIGRYTLGQTGGRTRKLHFFDVGAVMADHRTSHNDLREVAEKFLRDYLKESGSRSEHVHPAAAPKLTVDDAEASRAIARKFVKETERHGASLVCRRSRGNCLFKEPAEPGLPR